MRIPVGVTGQLPWLLIALLVLPGVAAAEEAPLRGDLPPSTASLKALLALPLEDDAAQQAFERLLFELQRRFPEERVSAADLYRGAMFGMLEAVNARQVEDASSLQQLMAPSSMLLTPTEAQRAREDLAGTMTGVGLEFQHRPLLGTLQVTRVHAGSPAARIGLRAGDQILSADGLAFAGRSLGQVLAQLEGDEGDQILLEVLRGAGSTGELFTVALRRERFALDAVEESLVQGEVGLVRVSRLYRGVDAQVEESLMILRRQGARRFLLDLRDNTGGDLTAAAELADLFLPESTVIAHVQEPGIGGSDLLAQREQVFDERLAVLVNRWTGGAAEALAAALQDHGQAYLIGERTLGSADLDTLVDLGPLVARLRSVKLQSPLGHSWAGVGLFPDAAVQGQQPTGPTEPGGQDRRLDPQFQTAVHYLQTEPW